MSDQGKPEDPWARWRKPDEKPQGDTPRNDGGAASTETPVVRPAPAVPASEQPVVSGEAVESSRPSGTLSVRKVVKATKDFVRKSQGGDQPGERRGGKSSEKREDSGRKTFDRREGGGAKGAGPKAAGAKTFGQPGERRASNPWSKPADDVRGAGKSFERSRDQARENPWAQASSKPGKPLARGATPPAAASWGKSVEHPSPQIVKQPASPDSGEAPSGVRLSKVMSERGLCSRREADLWISRGWVYVDGVQISELGSRIDPSADISISQDAKKDQAKQVTILLHKPVGYVSGQPEPGFTPAVTLISAETQLVQSGDPEFKPWMLRGLAPAGRLDVDSTGLLVLTQDGRVAKKLIGEDSETEKEYLVRVSGQMIEGGLELLNHGLELDGKPLKPARVKQLNEDQLHFILKEGKKRQIRRMCELVGLRVTGLKRVRIGRIRLGDLPMGQWRFLRADEAF